MKLYVDYWLDFMKHSDSLLAIPLLAAGLALMLAGWRLWRPALVLSFVVVGGVIGWLVGPSIGIPAIGALASAVILGIVAFMPARFSTAVLGGLIGCGVLTFALHSMGLQSWSLALSAMVAFVVVTAIANIYPRNVIILITAFEGAILIVSALFTLGGSTNNLMRHLSRVIEDSTILLPFALLVPTVIGCALQLADVNQKDSGVVQA